MNSKTTFILVGVLLVLIVVCAVFLLRDPPPADTSTYVLPALTKNKVEVADIDRVEISRPNERIIFVFEPDSGLWRMTEPFESRVEPGVVSILIGQVRDARKDENRDVTNDLKRYDLDPPRSTVTLSKGDKRWQIFLGSDTGQGGVVFVTSSDNRKEPMAVRRDALTHLQKPVNDYRSKTVLADSAADIESFKLVDDKDKVLALKKVPGTQNRWEFEQPKDYGEADYGQPPGGFDPAAKPGSGVHGALNALAGIRIEDKQNDFLPQVAPADLAKYGLAGPKGEYLTAEVRYTEGAGNKKQNTVTDTLLVGKPADEKGDKLYARLADKRYARQVFKVNKKTLEPLVNAVTDPTSLRDRTLVRLDAGAIDAIDLKDGDKPALKLRRTNIGWKLFVGDKSKPIDADRNQTMDLLAALTSRRDQAGKPPVIDFADVSDDAKKERGLDRKGAPTVSLWDSALPIKDEWKDEPDLKDKKDKPTVKLVFGNEDKDGGLWALRDGEGIKPSIVKVSKTLLERVTKDELAYYQRQLPPWPSGAEYQETGLVLKRPDGTFVLAKEKKDDKEAFGTWTIKEPKDVAGPADGRAVENLLQGGLRGWLRPAEFVKKQPSDQQLEEYGLKKPEYSVTIVFQKTAPEEKKDDKEDKKDDKDKKEEKKDDKDKKPEPEKTELKRTYLFGKKTPDGAGVYAMLDDKTDERKLVFIVRPWELLRTALDGELRDRKVFSFEVGKVKKLKVRFNKFLQTLELERKDNNTWAVKKPEEDFTLDDRNADAFLTMLSMLDLERFVKGGAKDEHELAKDKRNMEVEITLDDGKTLTLTVGKFDDKEKGYYAQASTLKDVFLLPTSHFERNVSGHIYKLFEPPPKGGLGYFSKEK